MPSSENPEQPKPDQPSSSDSESPKTSPVIRMAEIIWQGPLPPPEVVEKYEDILPGAAARIFTIFEKQANHRMDMEKSELRYGTIRSWGG